MQTTEAIIFDLGGVLIDWNPSYLFDNLFDDNEKKKHFFEYICTPQWNEEQDGGKLLNQATEELVARHPDWENQIRAYYGRWEEMLGGVIQETVDILEELKQNKNLKIYALTNWSAETFPVALERFEFLQWFDGIVVSGVEKTRKPFPDFYHRLIDRYGINPSESVFIDDNLRNVEGAESLGVKGIHFKNPEQLKNELNQVLKR